MGKRYAFVHKNLCVACGACENVCPKNAIKVKKGIYADVDEVNCVGCGICSKNCPAGAIDIRNRDEEKFDKDSLKEQEKKGACPMCQKMATNIPYTPIIPLPTDKRKGGNGNE